MEVVKILDKPLYQKHPKCLINLARPERFELLTTRFEATYSFGKFTAEPCGFLEIEFLLKTEIQGDKPQ